MIWKRKEKVEALKNILGTMIAAKAEKT